MDALNSSTKDAFRSVEHPSDVGRTNHQIADRLQQERTAFSANLPVTTQHTLTSSDVTDQQGSTAFAALQAAIQQGASDVEAAEQAARLYPMPTGPAPESTPSRLDDFTQQAAYARCVKGVLEARQNFIGQVGNARRNEPLMNSEDYAANERACLNPPPRLPGKFIRGSGQDTLLKQVLAQYHAAVNSGSVKVHDSLAREELLAKLIYKLTPDISFKPFATPLPPEKEKLRKSLTDAIKGERTPLDIHAYDLTVARACWDVASTRLDVMRAALGQMSGAPPTSCWPGSCT